LQPPGSTYSIAYAGYGDEQVGVSNPGGILRASLWRGSASSWVDLHPPGYAASEARGVYLGRQVGWIQVGQERHAAIWNETSESWVDLHAVLPPQFQWSEARAVWFGDPRDIYVVGFGFNAAMNRHEALFWTGPCSTDLNYDGVSDFFDYLDFVGLLDLGWIDFNLDCSVDFFDYLDFVAAFEVGCE
jgi:hypothetical protein